VDLLFIAMTEYESRAFFELNKVEIKPIMDMPDKPEFPNGWHTLILGLAGAALVMIIVSGCTAPKNLMARKDCEDKMRLVIEAMRARTDTIINYRIDTFVVMETKHDTTVKVDTFIHTVEKERLKLVWQVKHDSLWIQAQCRADTIYIPVKETTIKQGSTDGLAPPTEKEGWWRWWHWILLALILGATVWVAIFIKDFVKTTRDINKDD
jgi:hypothetical protein